MIILSIETSCDETAIALVAAQGGLERVSPRLTSSGREVKGGVKTPKFKVIKSVIASQIKIHRPWGGVVPSLAKREHIKNLPVLLKKIFKNQSYEIGLRKIDLVAVTTGPGLEPALWTGINFAKELAIQYQRPLIGVNHLNGHLYSFLLPRKNKSQNFKGKIFPAIALLVSGGHTILLLLKSFTKWKKLGETRDDAAGEAFDKVARLLDLPYPGGPELEKIAVRGNQSAIDFPRPMINSKNYDFSFSGLKTSVLYYLRDNKPKKIDVAASFQRAAVDVLTAKTVRAAKEFKAKSIMLSGGVSANKVLQGSLRKYSKKMGIQFFNPGFKYNTDNAAMIAVAAYIKFISKKTKTGFKTNLTANGNLSV